MNPTYGGVILCAQRVEDTRLASTETFGPMMWAQEAAEEVPTGTVANMSTVHACTPPK